MKDLQSYLKIFIIFIVCVFVIMYLSTICVPGTGPGVTNGHECKKLNPVPQQEEQMLLTMEPPLLPMGPPFSA